ncbi:heparinase II/III domain-containing protein [Acrocarpospora catenulata]|uniref:heparinase II/III domain-containing protein n=1 Tax=Acrocarpospora catenulata TaxID=2836182 RepID=UPI0027DEC260|nr:heparinase II/III family protein [Acrocarpospora catenulata]
MFLLAGSLLTATPASAVARTPECQGDWLPATPTAEEVMAGQLSFLDLPPVKIGEKVNWRLDPYKNRSWKMVFHSLRWVGRLVADYETTGKATYLSRATEVAKDWVAKNPPGSLGTYAWAEHPVALRAPALVCLSRHVPDKWLRDSLVQHARILDDDKHYEWGHNHGLDQDIGLLTIACRYGNAAWRKKAVSRMEKTTKLDVDAEGALREQAPRYAVYFHDRLRVAMDKLKDCGVKIPESLARRWDKLPEHISAATQPDGFLVPLGDGPADVQPAAYDRPDSLVQIYKAGYVFGRTAWGDRESAYYSIRFGPGLKFHGHEDHLGVTYYAQGRNILTEAGFHSYENTAYRRWTITPEAHNVPIVAGKKFRGRMATALIRRSIGKDRQSFTLTDTAYGTRRTRAVLVNHDKKDVMAVYDTVASGKVRNLWHLASGLKVVSNGGGRVVVSHGDGGWKASIVQLALPGCKPVSGQQVVSGQTNPYQGWISSSYMKKEAAPVVQSPAATGLLTIVVPGTDDPAVSCSGRTVIVRTPNGPATFKMSGKDLV